MPTASGNDDARFPMEAFGRQVAVAAINFWPRSKQAIAHWIVHRHPSHDWPPDTWRQTWPTMTTTTLSSDGSNTVMNGRGKYCSAAMIGCCGKQLTGLRTVRGVDPR